MSVLRKQALFFQFLQGTIYCFHTEATLVCKILTIDWQIVFLQVTCFFTFLYQNMSKGWQAKLRPELE